MLRIVYWLWVGRVTQLINRLVPFTREETSISPGILLDSHKYFAALSIYDRSVT